MLTPVKTFTALELCEQGEYKAAAELLGIRVGEWPENVSQGDSEYAEALLAAGQIASAMGGIQQAGDQAPAWAMLLESIRLFGDDSRADVARSWLAWVDYWAGDRDGALARVEDVLRADLDDRTRFRSLLLRVSIYSDTLQTSEALTGLTDMAHLYDRVGPLLKGKFHLQRGRVLRLTDDTDAAILDYDQAINFFQQIGNLRCQAMAANNLAGVYLATERFPEAHDYAERARLLFHQLGDKTYEAQAWDQRALAYLAEDKLDEAERAIHNGLSLIEHGEVLNELLLTRDKIRRAQMANETPNPSRPRKGSVIMSPLDCASYLADKYPDEAEKLYDLFVWGVSASGDPQHSADTDEVESIFFAKTQHCEREREKYRRSRLVHEVTSDP